MHHSCTCPGLPYHRAVAMVERSKAKKDIVRNLSQRLARTTTYTSLSTRNQPRLQ